jgi:basic amino acid/polyamine antiporter, APA family
MPESKRTIGVFGATLVGLGGILGGGLLMLAGVAFRDAGPSVLLAMALNAVVAWLTAMSVTECSTMFPESGGAYMFSKKVLSVRAAFAVGWILWFAYIVAAVLYALGFAQFTVILLRGVLDALGLEHPSWFNGRNILLGLATLAAVLYSLSLARTGTGGGRWETIGKVVLFVAIVAAGVVTLVRQPISESVATLDPFFTGGLDAIIAAMGLLFISLQGFEMIPAVAGEIKDPKHTIPRAVFLSLAISIAIYVPMLFVVATGGVEPGQSIGQLAQHKPDLVVANAAQRFLGPTGYWMIVVSIVLATLSALQANLLTASRISYAMAGDHTLPSVMKQTHPTRGTPIMAIYATTLAVVAIMFMIPNLAGAGAAASLIFLAAFALTHMTAYLARKRSRPIAGIYKTPLFPLVPLVGGLSCAALAVFQAFIVPDAGGIVLIWAGLGVILYMALFKGRAEVADASAEALDPVLAMLRGKSPLVLLPISNPLHARSLVEVANALAPTEYARVLLLTIVSAPKTHSGDPLAQLAEAQDSVKQALTASYSAGHAPEALLTAASDEWEEIQRIADEHRCESLLLGFPDVPDEAYEANLERMMNELDCDIAVMRASADWTIKTAKRVLVAIGGRGEEHELRARLLGTLCREMPREIVFVTVIPANADEDTLTAAVRSVTKMSEIRIPVKPSIEVIRSDDAAGAILSAAERADLLLLGIGRGRNGKKTLGAFNRRLATEARCAVMLLARKPPASADMVRPIRDVGGAIGTVGGRMAKVLPWSGKE